MNNQVEQPTVLESPITSSGIETNKTIPLIAQKKPLNISKIITIAIVILLLYLYIIDPALFSTRIQDSNALPHFTNEPVAIKVIQIHTGYPQSYFSNDQATDPKFINAAGHYLIQTSSGDLRYDGKILDSGSFEQLTISENGKHFGYIKDSEANDGMKELYVDGNFIRSASANSNFYLLAISDNGESFYSYVNKGKIQIYKGNQLLSAQPYTHKEPLGQYASYEQNYDGTVGDFQISPDGRFYSFYSVTHYFFNNKEITAPAEFLNLLNLEPYNTNGITTPITEFLNSSNLEQFGIFFSDLSGTQIDAFTFSDNGQYTAYAVNAVPTFPDGGARDNLYVDGRKANPNYSMNSNTFYDGTFQINNEGKVAAIPGIWTSGIIMQNIHFENIGSNIIQINEDQTHVLSRANEGDDPTTNDYLLDGKPLKLPLLGGTLASTIPANDGSSGLELYKNTIYIYKFIQ